MRYELLGLSLALTALLVLWVLFTLAGRLVWRAGRKRLAQWSPRARAGWLFVLQVGPLLGAAGVVFGLVLPAYIAYEPHVTDEPYSFSFLVPSLLCLAILFLAARRSLLTWRLTRRLLQDWQRGAVCVRQTPEAIPVWQIEHPLPLIAVVGVLRPQMFVAAHLFERLSPDELAAVLRHEQWHLAARDNLRRVIFDFCQHGLGFLRGGRELEREWQENVEMAADEYAAHNPQTALDLASALVKIARLFPPRVSITMPAMVSPVLLEDSSLARRVQRLLALGETSVPRPLQRLAAMWPASVAGLFLLTLMLMGIHSDILRAVHEGIELIVATLP